jgi:anaerobic ribonucleoside-triphosphate reductase activating protein
MQDKTIRLHRFEPASRVNGPGLRAVIWVQGCALGCPGCFNPETHTMNSGETWPVEKLVERILEIKNGPEGKAQAGVQPNRPRIEGLTISGGEPLHQHRALARLIEQVRNKTDLSILVFTGYDWDELQRLKGIDRFLANVDVLIAGRYDASRRVAQGLIGSANKVAHFLTDRYTEKDLEAVPQAEIILSPDGEIILSGIDPLKW